MNTVCMTTNACVLLQLILLLLFWIQNLSWYYLVELWNVVLLYNMRKRRFIHTDLAGKTFIELVHYDTIWPIWTIFLELFLCSKNTPDICGLALAVSVLWVCGLSRSVCQMRTEILLKIHKSYSYLFCVLH